MTPLISSTGWTDALTFSVLKQAAIQNIKIVTTFDTLSKCAGISTNMQTLDSFGAEIAYPDIPWGINAQQLLYMMHYTHMKAIEVLQTATFKAGKHLEIPLLGTLQAQAPADIIAVKGNVLHNFKSL